MVSFFLEGVLAKVRNFTVFLYILLQYAAVQKPQKGGGNSIHFLNALFKTNSEISVSRSNLWGLFMIFGIKDYCFTTHAANRVLTCNECFLLF